MGMGRGWGLGEGVGVGEGKGEVDGGWGGSGGWGREWGEGGWGGSREGINKFHADNRQTTDEANISMVITSLLVCLGLYAANLGLQTLLCVSIMYCIVTVNSSYVQIFIFFRIKLHKIAFIFQQTHSKLKFMYFCA